MIFNREQEACYGRGFSETGNLGFLENFYNWIARDPVATPVGKVSGGPGWYIIDDQSAANPNPYIVVSQHTAANVAANPNRTDEPHKIIKIGLLGAESGYVWVESYLWWDVAGAVGAAHTGYGLWSSHKINTYDSADFVYDFRGGPDLMIIQSRRGTNWDTFVFGEWTGDVNLVEGVNVVGDLNIAIGGAPVTDHVIQLGAGEATNFTEGNWYWLYDFANGNNWCNYVRVDDVDAYGDRLQINAANYDFPIGSVIGSYVHRFYTLSDSTNVATDRSYQLAEIPYYSRYGYEMYTSHGAAMTRLYAGITLSREDEYLGYRSTQYGMAPNDRNQYACQRPGVQEYRSHDAASGSIQTDMNRGFGPLAQVYLTPLGVGAGDMAAAQDGRTINGLNYLYFQIHSAMAGGGNSQQALLFPDYDSIV